MGRTSKRTVQAKKKNGSGGTELTPTSIHLPFYQCFGRTGRNPRSGARFCGAVRVPFSIFPVRPPFRTPTAPGRLITRAAATDRPRSAGVGTITTTAVLSTWRVPQQRRAERIIFFSRSAVSRRFVFLDQKRRQSRPTRRVNQWSYVFIFRRSSGAVSKVRAVQQPGVSRSRE